MRERVGWPHNKATVIMMSVLLMVLVGGGLTSSQSTNVQTNMKRPLHEAIYSRAYLPVDNIYCDHLEGMVMHLHAHVSLYINGQNVAIPQYVGIARNANNGRVICYYWLHVHDHSGIIHIEPPVRQTFTLGQFLNEWQQRFGGMGFPEQLLLTSGWRIWTNGLPYHGTLESIPLTEHTLITLAYNSPNARPDIVYAWPY
jgi:hypothetical protein